MPTEAEEGEKRMAAETLDERATTLRHLHVATSCLPHSVLHSPT